MADWVDRREPYYSIGVPTGSSERIPRVPFQADERTIVPKEFKGHAIKRIDIYVMFLFETETLISEQQLKIQENLLGKTLQDFSKKIGMRALAVWLIEDAGGKPDVDRNLQYQQKFGLNTKKAPHIVILTKHPDDWKKGDKLVSFSFNRAPMDRVYVILADIADYIRENKVPRYRMKLRLIYEALRKWLNDHKQDLKEGAEIAANWLPKNASGY